MCTLQHTTYSPHPAIAGHAAHKGSKQLLGHYQQALKLTHSMRKQS